MSSHPGLVNLDDPANYEDDWDAADRRHVNQGAHDG